MPAQRWSWRSGSEPGEFDLVYGDTVAGTVVWLRDVVQPANTMDEICRGLQADAGQLRADEGSWWWRSTDRDWWFEIGWQTAQIGSLVWYVKLNSPAATMTRVVAGLNGRAGERPEGMVIEPAPLHRLEDRQIDRAHRMRLVPPAVAS